MLRRMRPLFIAALMMVCIGASAAPRSRIVLHDFQRANPCPATDARRGRCPGHEIDHIQPLCAGGADAVENLQWLTHEEHARKTKRDVAACRRRVYRP